MRALDDVDRFDFIETKFDQADEQELFTRLTFHADKGQDLMRIDKWVQMRIEGASRNKVQQAIEGCYLTVNGKAVKANYRIKPGDEVVMITLNDPEVITITPEDIPLDIVYEDEDIMVVNKPANMVVHPAIGNFKGTLLNAVAYYFKQQNPDVSEDILPRFGLVHRIDKNTTGLLVLAKNLLSASHLSKQFFYHTIKRKYKAIVWGDLNQDKGTINANIARHRQNRKTFDAYPDGDVGKYAITHYKLLESFYYVSLIECQLETGRTHQIRVHMKHIGHTLFNDWEYGGDKILKGTIYTKYKQFVENCFEVCPRCALHAYSLGFEHPRTGKKMYFESELPDDMKNVLEKWRGYTTQIHIK